MNIYYNPLDIRCKSTIGGIRQNEKFTINIFGNSNEPCSFVLQRDGGEAQHLHMQKIPQGWSITLFLRDPGLYFYCFQIGERYAGCGKDRCAEFAERSVNYYQILVYAEGFTTPEWFKGGIMYQIFPDRFFKKGEIPAGQGKWLHKSWDEKPEYRPNEQGKVLNNDFFGGNLRGIIEKLNYLQSLHVTVLYLNPIFKAFSNHRYDTGDYKQIDTLLGTEEDFAALTEECNKRGIKIMLDGVFNHTGDDSRYFNKYGTYDELGAYQSRDSKYYAWYTFTQYPNKYDSWWGIDCLPAVNENCSSYVDFITGEDGVLRYWLKYDLAGFRLDVADELPDEFIVKIRNAVKGKRPDALVLGEVWEDASNKIAYSKRRQYFQGQELDSVMNYPLKNAIIHFIMSNDTTVLRNTIAMLRDNYPKIVLDSLMNILGTHDTVRILTAFGGISAKTKDEMSVLSMDEQTRALAKERLKAAAVLLFTLPGVPCIYYGDEIGMEGYADPFCRMPFQWNHIDTDILNHYRKLAQIRTQLSVFNDSDYRELFHDENCLIYERRKGGEVAVIAVNRGQNKFDLQYQGILYDLFAEKEYQDRYEIKPLSWLILSNIRIF